MSPSPALTLPVKEGTINPPRLLRGSQVLGGPCPGPEGPLGGLEVRGGSGKWLEAAWGGLRTGSPGPAICLAASATAPLSAARGRCSKRLRGKLSAIRVEKVQNYLT